jgi:uncharacterized membrane protein
MRMSQVANHFRFHRPHLHLHSPFGDDWFGRRAESFARFFGTPRYLLMQTVLVLCWIALNAMGSVTYDPYPFILLNLVFSTQAAYAAPMILLAQTRQADREKAHTDADAQHREEIARAQLELLTQNTDITEQVARLATQIEALTREIHGKLVQDQRA